MKVGEKMRLLFSEDSISSKVILALWLARKFIARIDMAVTTPYNRLESLAHGDP